MLFASASTRDPFGEMRGLLRRMDDVFRAVDQPLSGLSMSTEAWPAIELHDAGEEFMIAAEIPGMNEKNVSIDATANGMTIRGTKDVELPEGYTPHRRERRSVRFARTVSFPQQIDLEGIRASVKDGVLTIRAAKVPEERPKQITVKAS